jgi:hypothetical protein
LHTYKKSIAIFSICQAPIVRILAKIVIFLWEKGVFLEKTAIYLLFLLPERLAVPPVALAKTGGADEIEQAGKRRG